MNVTEVLRRQYVPNAYYNCRTKEEKADSSFPLNESGEGDGTTEISEESKDAGENAAPEMHEGILMTPQELRDFLRRQIELMYKELQAGRKEPSYQIGAASYTLKEWEEMLGNFDKVQEEIREAIREEIAKRAKHVDQKHYLVKEKSRAEKEADILTAVSGKADPKKTEEKARTSAPSNYDQFTDMITAEYTMARFPMAEGEEEKDALYITVYTAEEVYCRRAGEADPIWEIPLESGQYEKIMAFLDGDHFAEGDNFTFAANQSFWEDFLSGKLDMDGFMDFWDYRVKDGIADILDETEDGVYINREAAKYGMYTNRPDWFHMLDPRELIPGGEGAVFPEGWEGQMQWRTGYVNFSDVSYQGYERESASVSARRRDTYRRSE